MPDFSEIPPERKPPRGTEETDFPVPAQPPPLERRMSGRERLMTIITAAIVAAFVTIILVFGMQVVLKIPVPSDTPSQQGPATAPGK